LVTGEGSKQTQKHRNKKQVTLPTSAVRSSNGIMDLDKVMDEVGHFGKFQGLCYFLLSFSIFYAAIAGLSYVFTTSNVNYR
jgi:hypothetical protein